MSDDNPDDSDRDESPDDRDYENDHWLASLLSALESLESDTTATSGRRQGDRVGFEYDISIRSGDDLSATDSPLDRLPLGGDEGSTRDSRRSRTRRARSSGPSSDHNVATRTYDDELLVTADVADTDPDDVTVGFDDATLVIAVDGRELDHIEVPWRETDAQATIKNGVLTVRIRPEPTATDGTDAMEDDG